MRTRMDRLRVVKYVLSLEDHPGGPDLTEAPRLSLAAGGQPQNSAGKPASAVSKRIEDLGGNGAVSGGAERAGSGSVAEPPRRQRPGRLQDRSASTPAAERLVSLDAFRGFIMMMLAAGGFGLLAFSKISESAPVWQQYDRAFWKQVGFHFDHPAWVSIRNNWMVSFWDLIQPAFMFMVGVSMPYSYARREARGHGWLRRAGHALGRSVILVLIGVFLSSMGKDRTNWIFPNVLCQIGLGYFFAWLLLNRRVAVQFAALAIILTGYWGWFRLNPPPADYDFSSVNAVQAEKEEETEVFTGSMAAWSKNGNAAFLFDQWLLPRLRCEKSPESAADVPVQAANPVRPRIRFAPWRLAVLPTVQEPPGQPQTAPAPAPAVLEDTPPLPADFPAQQETPQQTGPTATEPSAAPADAAAESGKSAAAAEPQQPAWYRQWFFSNTDPYEPNRGGYTTLNFIPSIGTTLLGIICGQLLFSNQRTAMEKLGLLLVLAVGCFVLGVAAHQTVCPIVKRIWTPSWVLFSGGYVIAMLAVFYLLFDILPLRILAFPLVVVGTNSILTYMLGQTISGWVREQVVRVHFTGVLENVFGPRALDPLWYGPITLPAATFAVYWLFLLWLYRQKIFLRI
ncbi:MAG: acyltransferase family protein [Planctomycetaceae bacterium]